jgi:RNA polymerase sigma factor (sigma-70 family)
MPTHGEQIGGLSDAEILIESLAVPAEFAVIFDRHYDAIAPYLGRRVDRPLADELASETFMRAFAAREAYDPGQLSARPWLYGIAIDLLRKHARGEERRWRAYARAVEHDQSGGGLEGADARVDAAALGAAVAAALGRLRDADREVLLLYALTDLDYEGIAIAVGAPVGTVRSRLHRARRRARAELGLNEAAIPDMDARTERSVR